MTSCQQISTSPPGEDVPEHATLEKCLAASASSTVAVIGLAKNVGKTTAVNELLATSSHRLGLTSLGLDGEAIDHVSGLPKPRIAPPRGALIATTEGSLQRSGYELGSIERLPFRTALGAVVVGTASGVGCVEVSGPTTLEELRLTVARLHERGAERVLVDGALNRLGSASPRVSEGVILATGAVVGDTVADVVRATVAAVEALTLPQISATGSRALTTVGESGERLMAFDTEWRRVSFRARSGLSSRSEFARETADRRPARIYFEGALTDEVLESLVRVLPAKQELDLIVRDPTVIVAPASRVHQFLQRGLRLEVQTALNLLAVTVSPFRPVNRPDGAELFDSLAAALGERTALYDVVGGRASPAKPQRHL